MNRGELEDAICDEVGVDDEFGRSRTRTNGLGEDTLITLYEYFDPDAPGHRARFGDKARKRKRIADLLGLELENPDDIRITDRRIDRNFRKGELEQIHDLFQERPEQNTWASVLSWPPQAQA